MSWRGEGKELEEAQTRSLPGDVLELRVAPEGGMCGGYGGISVGDKLGGCVG